MDEDSEVIRGFIGWYRYDIKVGFGQEVGLRWFFVAVGACRSLGFCREIIKSS